MLGRVETGGEAGLDCWAWTRGSLDLRAANDTRGRGCLLGSSLPLIASIFRPLCHFFVPAAFDALMRGQLARAAQLLVWIHQLILEPALLDIEHLIVNVLLLLGRTPPGLVPLKLWLLALPGLPAAARWCGACNSRSDWARVRARQL